MNSTAIHSTARKHLGLIALIMAFAAFAVNANPKPNIAKPNIILFLIMTSAGQTWG